MYSNHRCLVDVTSLTRAEYNGLCVEDNARHRRHRHRGAFELQNPWVFQTNTPRLLNTRCCRCRCFYSFVLTLLCCSFDSTTTGTPTIGRRSQILNISAWTICTMIASRLECSHITVCIASIQSQQQPQCDGRRGLFSSTCCIMSYCASNRPGIMGNGITGSAGGVNSVGCSSHQDSN